MTKEGKIFLGETEIKRGSLVSIVRSMMEHASSGTGERDLVDVNTFVNNYVDLALHSRYAEPTTLDVQIERIYAEDAGQVELVPQDMGRVLLNLLSNAFDAVQEKAQTVGGTYQPTIRVETQRTENAIAIRVTDNGPGIKKNLLLKIFEPFYTTKPTGSGTGLGLSLSYDIVTQGHGGTLTVDSTQGEGTTFAITLPE